MYIIIAIHDILDFFYTVLYFYFFPFLFFAFLIFIFVKNVQEQNNLTEGSISLDKASLDILFKTYKEYYETKNQPAT